MTKTTVRIATIALAVATSAMGLAQPASATISSSSTALDLANATAADPSVITGASFVAQPTSASPPPAADAVSDTPLTSFPTNGSSYAILTSGNALDAATDDATNADPLASTVYSNSDVRNAFDVTILKVDLSVPAGANCLSVNFRFLSEEFQQFVGKFNDAFIAELDTNDWTVDPQTQAISAPHDFALDPNGNVVSVNNTGVAAMSAANGAGTVYRGAIDATHGMGGATQLLTAQTPVTAGAHSVFFSIFDAGDHKFDSAVFLDNLVVGTAGPQGCQARIQPGGQADLSLSKSSVPATVTGGNDVSYPVTVTNNGSGGGLTALSAQAAGDATGVTITDHIPPGSSFVSASGTGWTCSFDSETGVVTCTLGTPLGVGASSTVNVVVMAPNPSETTTITDTAHVSADQLDPNPANNDASATTTVAPKQPDHSTGFVPPQGGTVSTGANPTPTDPTVTSVTLPPGGPGGVVTIDETPQPAGPSLCDGDKCLGQVSNVTLPPGYGDVASLLIRVKLKYDHSTIADLPPGYDFEFFKDAVQLVRCGDNPGRRHPCVRRIVILPESGNLKGVILMASNDPALTAKG